MDAPPLRFGTLVHKALAAYYKPGRVRGPHPAKTFTKIYADEVKRVQRDFPKWVDEDEVWHDHLSLGQAMLEGYVEHFTQTTHNNDAEFRVISSEQTFAVDLTEYANARSKRLPKLAPTTIVGTFDGVWQRLDTGALVFPEFKTAKTIRTDHLALDDQAGTYWMFGPPWLAQNTDLLPKSNGRPSAAFEGILYRFLRKAKPDTRPINAQGQYLNLDGTVSKKQPSPLFAQEMVYRDQADRHEALRRTLNAARRIGLVRARQLDHDKQPSPFTCMGCPFKDPCEVHEMGGDYEALLDQLYTEWDPYADHEDYGESTVSTNP